VRYSLRVLRKSPGFTIAAVLTLALAIGANAVVFAVLNALILRPLNVPNAESLYTIERGGYKEQATSYPDYLDLRARNRSFEDLTAYTLAPVGLDTGNNPAQAWTYEVTGNYFDALGFSLIWAASSTTPMNMVPTARRTWYSVTHIGIAIFRTIAVWWAALSR